MKKFLIFKKLEDGTYGEKLGSYEAEQKDDSSKNRSWLAAEPMASHFELAEDIQEEEAQLILEDGVWKITKIAQPDGI